MFLSISAYAATLVVAIAFILLMAAGRSPDVLKDLTLFKVYSRFGWSFAT